MTDNRNTAKFSQSLIITLIFSNSSIKILNKFIQNYSDIFINIINFSHKCQILSESPIQFKYISEISIYSNYPSKVSEILFGLQSKSDNY